MVEQLALLLGIHMTISLGEQGVVFTDTDVNAGMELGTTLTNNDAARWNQFATKSFNAEAFRL